MGQRIEDVRRRGKYIIIPLSGKDTLIIHLKMAGALLATGDLPDRWLRAIFRFDDGSQLVFIDRRRFARMSLVKDTEPILRKLGPEPLQPEFTERVLRERLRGRKTPIKALLLDQTFLAGVGNMYADEALFSAKIHPTKRADSLTPAETRRLYKAVREVLLAAIGNKGASIEAYIRPDGSLGTAHFYFRVAHQRGKNCPVCGTPIKRIVVRGRGTYFCPKCQGAT